ncbi:neuraminidase-like domain-containing protein [Bradyrhizobium sp. CCBAU 53380]|uniref:Tc toxin subunit A-related protein n=1 Tax=Bradyrhizobium sp. CCBAU 53380 TaxID=1325117 RepID=UPI0023026D7F|nr:neuraminidase-like domain-containing protein [Bradyrhizobium sp. CCBAU 53380]MDA9421112.1 hypothetical protein [Bradyrhizobium sp. CCBAU 53380]
MTIERPILRLATGRFAAFFRENPNFDLLSHDFFDPKARAALKGAVPDVEAQLEELKVYQRLARVMPYSDPEYTGVRSEIETVAARLVKLGFSSAHDISSRSEHHFVDKAAGALGGDRKLAGEIHRRAVQIKAAARHLFANVRDVVGSRYSRAGLANFADAELTDYFEGMPSYQSMFGSLDYYEVPECNSIFSPAAYFLDIMRITDEYITYYNKETIPPGYRLDERRRDLFDEIKLTCEETTTTLPYISLINQIFVKRLTVALGQDPYRAVATAPYPFNLPFNRPLTETNIYLAKLGTSLNQAGQAMLASIPSALGFTSNDLARAYLGLSAEQVAEVVTVNTTDAAIGAQYGLDLISKALPSAGTGTVTYAKNTMAASGGQLGTLQVHQEFQSQGQIRTVIKIVDATNVRIDVPWVLDGSNVAYTVFGYPTDMTRVSTFCDRVGAMTFEDVDRLFTQGLSEAEFAAGDADGFFINNTGEGLSPLRVDQADAQLGNIYARIDNLSQKRLDRLSRFLRLSRLTGIDFEALDWLMRVCGASEITQDFLTSLAAIKQLAAVTEREIPVIAPLVGAFKTSGRGKGPIPNDPFDMAFNAPSLLNGRSPYLSSNPVPFDPARPLAWSPDNLANQKGISGTLQSATQSEATLAADASAVNGAYIGLELSITKGPGAGQALIIRAYDGASRKATLYAPWGTTPTGTSEYLLSAAVELEDRLTAALQIKKTDLPSLGAYYKAANAPAAVALTLDLATLTGLWRLGQIGRIFNLPPGEYLVARALAGLSGQYAATASAALADVQSAISIVQWLADIDMSAYELSYVLTGVRTRYVKPAFDPQSVPTILTDLATSSKALQVTATTFVQIGLSEALAKAIVDGLTADNILDTRGLVIPHDTLFATIAADFPITVADLTAKGGLSDAEAGAALDALTAQLPPVLSTLAGDNWNLTANYMPGTSLDYLFLGVAGAANKQLFVSGYLEGIAAAIDFQMLSPYLPIVADTSFQTATIGAPQSKAVFNALKTTTPATILPGKVTDTGYLSANYNGSTAGWALFTSPATGQSNIATAYNGTTRTVTVQTVWMTVPDAFTTLQIVAMRGNGTAQAGSVSTITLASNASSDNGAYDGYYIALTGGTGSGQRRLITAYDGTTKIATVVQNWTTVPDSTSAYTLQVAVFDGSADGGTNNTVILDRNASNADGAYSGLTLLLVPDAEAANKTEQVRNALNAVQSNVVLLAQTLGTSAGAQQSAVTGAMAEVLALSADTLAAGLPYASSASQPRLLVPTFLGGNTIDNQVAATKVLDGLSRFDLLRSKIAFADGVWSDIARRPDLFNITKIDALSYADLRRLSGFVTLCTLTSADAQSFACYLEMWQGVVGMTERLDALYDITGWVPGQIAQIDAFLIANLPSYAGLYKLDGLLRLSAPFTVIAGTGSDASFLITLSGLVKAPSLGPIGGAINAKQWTAMDDAAAACLAAVAARFRDQDFAVISDQLRRSADTAKRDALAGYLLWLMNKTYPSITNLSALSTYLLIDIEASDCDTTSPIAQGINSVQLYLQRCRMGLEPGVTVDNIPVVWWTWLSTYRMWEVNRKIFLYPENYIVPSQRSGASPEFRQLTDDLLQARPTDENVAAAMVKYFDSFEVLAGLVTVGGYKSEQSILEGGQIDETCILVGRTNVSPYKYFTRTFTRSSLPELVGTDQPWIVTEWSPWINVDVTIKADFITPVWAFDRLFFFWNEVTPSKSSTISDTGGSPGSNTQSSWEASLYYTFQTSTGKWLAAQALGNPAPIRIAPNDYAPANNSNILVAYDPPQHYWHQPFAQSVPRGLPGTGTLTYAAGGTTATGNRTRLDRQISPGDFIYTGGQKLQVESINAANQTLVTKSKFVLSGTAAQFNVVPKDPQRYSYSPYDGQGTVSVVKGQKIVDGTGTQFTIDFSPGDFIQIGPETRTVAAVFGDEQMTVTEKWTVGTMRDGTGTVTIFKNLTAVAGNGTKFSTEAAPMEQLVVDGQSRTISEIEDDTSLLINSPYDLTVSKTEPYRVGTTGLYKVIPRANGAERLIVFYGPNMSIQTNYGQPTGNPEQPNPGDDPFIAAKNDYNTGIYQSLNLISVVKSETSLPQNGDITGQRSLMLNSALEQQPIRLYAPDYNPATFATTTTIRTIVDRENKVLFSSPTQRPLISVYWGDSAPGTTANQAPENAESRVLLYHINGTSAVQVGVGNQIGWSLFNNNTDSFFFAAGNLAPVESAPGLLLRTFWQPSGYGDLQIAFGPYTQSDTGFGILTFQVKRLNTTVAQALKQRLYVGFDTLLSLGSQFLPETPFDQYYQVPGGQPPAALDPKQLPAPVMDFHGAYGLYFWEMFFHGPLLVAEWLKSNMDYETAKRWYEYIFDPTATDDTGVTGSDRYWRFRPFRENMNIPSLQQSLTNQFEINKYNNDPFDPNAIARLRISAYAKTTVIKYVDNLILWGDALFTVDTRESITQATNLYLLAQELLGTRPQVVGQFEQKKKLTYNEIKALYPSGGIPQFLIDLENTPFVPATGQGERYADVPVNDIHAYFGVPDNQELRLMWDRIDDRLYKIRHCMNINGVTRQLALFAPPIDPHAVIAGIGAAGSLAGGAGYMPYPVPAFRFTYLVDVARSLAEFVISMGSAMLNAIERKDDEALSQLRLTQEAQVLQITTQIKQLTIAQLNKQIESLQQAKLSAKERESHYKDLVSGGMIPEEIAQQVMLGLSVVFSSTSSVLGAAASVASTAPQIGSPFALTYGGVQLGASLQNASGWTEVIAKLMETTANILGNVANHKRQVQDWELQQSLATFDAAQFDAQIAATQIQVQMAQRDLQIQTVTIEQNEAQLAHYKNKFANKDLYAWMAGRLSATYFQAYSLALEMARMAQRSYQYEYRTDTSFLAVTYWDDLRKGLTAGEGIMLALNQMQSAFIRNGARLQCITKMVSLQELDPQGFITFQRTGEATISFGERMFDEDFPGQYMRRIDQVYVTVLTAKGPIPSIYARLTQTANRVVIAPNINAVKFLLGDDVEVPAGVIEHNVRAYQRVSLSKGESDPGTFFANTGDPLYLPFEQTGAISTWQFSMPPVNNPIDFSTISDVVIELRYCALDGGEAFRNQVANLPQLRQRQWNSLSQPAVQNPQDWSTFMTGPVSGEKQTLTFKAAGLLLPNIGRAEVTSFFLNLVLSQGTQLGSQHAYVSVKIGNRDPVAVLPGPNGTALGVLERPFALGTDDAAVEISFDLRAGYTPSGLRDVGGNRLCPTVLIDTELVLYMTGQS